MDTFVGQFIYFASPNGDSSHSVNVLRRIQAKVWQVWKFYIGAEDKVLSRQ